MVVERYKLAEFDYPISSVRVCDSISHNLGDWTRIYLQFKLIYTLYTLRKCVYLVVEYT